jgi:hypothetical protein
MRSFRRFKMRRGFAMIFVILIALAMIIPVLILATSTIPRRTAVTGEAISDRVLTVADATVDNIITQINNFPFSSFTTPTYYGIEDPDDPDSNAEVIEAIQKNATDYLVAHYLAQLNGGNPDIDSLSTIEGHVATYLYNLETQEYYAVWDTVYNQIADVSIVGPDGDIATGIINNINTNDKSTMSTIDPNYKTDNLWIEVDTRSNYVSDQWNISLTAYLVSKPDIKRTIKAIASRGTPLVNPGYIPGTPEDPGTDTYEEKANGAWFTQTMDLQYFSDYSGLYHTKVYFGQYETTRGMIRSDSDLYMGGWAEDPVFAHGAVYDNAIDDGNNHDGRFGPGHNNLYWAKHNVPKYATDGYAVAYWPNGAAALINLKNATGSLPPYYILGSATIDFFVENGVGMVKINGVKYNMPLNGAIYVTGTATVSGTVKGRCTIGAGVNINIGGDIFYDTPPKLDKGGEANPNPDLLGLIANNDILIPVNTFNLNHHLEIDAAMLAVNGNFGIGSGYAYHPINGTGLYEAWWNGSQAVYKTDNAPAIVSGNSVAGYDIQHTNFDWNLYQYGPPPFYPATGSTPVTKYVQAPADKLAILQDLNKNDLTPLIPPEVGPDGSIYYYTYVLDDVTYYYGNTFNLIHTHFPGTPGTLGKYSASAQMNSTPLYRITWKEQVAQPVKP